jgi:DNA-binding NarL/FixJ family response regulator
VRVRKPHGKGDPASGVRVFDLELGGEVLKVLSMPARVDLPDVLSEGERDVVLGVLEGLTNAEIAERRGTAPRTVANQLASIFRKLGVTSRGDLTARVVRSMWEGP